MYKLINICRCIYIRVLYNLIKIIMKMRGIYVVIIYKMVKDFFVCGIYKYILKEKYKIIKIWLLKIKKLENVNVFKNNIEVF